MERKDDRRSRRTRRLITTAMTELLMEKPYDAITVQAILDRADIGRATFYHHFRDKLDVVDAVVQEMFEGLHEADPAMATAGNVPVLALFRHAGERFRSLRAMLDTPGAEVFWTESHASTCSAIESSLGTPAALRTRSAVPAPIQAQFIAGALLAVLKWWLRAGMPHPPQQMAAWFEILMPPDMPSGPAGG